jgi:hypothetical protein
MFIVLSLNAIHHFLSASTPNNSMVLPEFGAVGKAQYMFDTRNIYHIVNNACTDAFGCLNADCFTSLPEVEG